MATDKTYRVMMRPTAGGPATFAVSGTLNQTGWPDERASTFDDYAQAEEAMDLVQRVFDYQAAVWIEEVSPEEIIAATMTECEAEARKAGDFPGPWEPTEPDCDLATMRVMRAIGRKPRRDEWPARFRWVGSRHYED